MIWYMQAWKDELGRIAKRTRRRLAMTRWGDHSLALLHRDVTLGCCAVRKLIESQWVSSTLLRRQIPLRNFPPPGKPVTRFSWTRIPELYDDRKGKRETRGVLFVCNQIIHSYVLLPVIAPDNRAVSLLVTSDRSREKGLFSVRAEAIAAIFEMAAADDPLFLRIEKNPRTGDHDFVGGRHVSLEEC